MGGFYFVVLWPQCSALAAAVLGNRTAFEVVNPEEEEKFGMLANGTIDVLVTRQSITMEQNVFEVSSSGA